MGKLEQLQEAPRRLELVDDDGDKLIVSDGATQLLDWPWPRLEATLGACEDQECVHLDRRRAEELRDFLDAWLAVTPA